MSIAKVLAVTAGLMLAGASSGSAQSPCDVVAGRARTADLATATLARRSLLEALSSALPGVAAVGTTETSGTVGTVEAHMRAAYRLSPPLEAALAKVVSYGNGWAADLSRFGRGTSGLRMLESAQGTAYCQVLLFFDVAADGSAEAIANPPNTDGLCLSAAGSAGEIDGTPTFIVENQRLPSTDIVVSLTPWQRGAWQRTCRIAFTFSNVFSVADRSCDGIDCRRIEGEVLRQVERLDRRQPRPAGDPPIQRDKIEKMMALAREQQVTILPTLMRDTPGLFQSSFTEFREPAFVPMVFEGETYLAQIGHGVYRGWTTPDYLFVAYRLVDDRLEPAASFYVTNARGRLLSATVD